MVDFLRPYHPHGLQNPSPGYHGYGYRLMCRFFAGLIVHAPPVSLFDYYWRLDNGDSRVVRIREDPFSALMSTQGALGVHRLPGGNFGSAFRSAAGWQGAVTSLVKDVGGVNNRKGRARGSGIGAALPAFHGNVVEAFLRSPQPGLYYNNFEVLDMRRFRGLHHWQLFLAAERKQLFLCPVGTSCDAALTARMCRTEGEGWAARCHGK